MTRTQGVKAADMTLKVFSSVAFAPEPIGVTAVARAVCISKSAAFKHLHTLMEHGFVVQEPNSSLYIVGPKIGLIAKLWPGADSLESVAIPLMREVRNRTGLSIVLSSPAPRNALAVATVRGTHAIDIGARPGSDMSLHASAQGKILLAFGSAAYMDTVRRENLPRLTEQTITDHALLAEEIGRVRARGYATAFEQVLPGVNAIAAPVFDHSYALVGVVAMVGSIKFLSEPPAQEHTEIIVKLASDITQRVGSGLLVSRRAKSRIGTFDDLEDY